MRNSDTIVSIIVAILTEGKYSDDYSYFCVKLSVFNIFFLLFYLSVDSFQRCIRLLCYVAVAFSSGFQGNNLITFYCLK